MTIRESLGGRWRLFHARCPKCGHILDRIMFGWHLLGTWSRSWPKPQYCPYCRIDLDGRPGQRVVLPSRLKAAPGAPTVREVLNREKRRCWLWFWASVTALVCGICLAPVCRAVPVLAVVGLVAAGLGFLGACFTLLPLHDTPCPNCGDSMRALMWLRSDRPFAIPSDVRYCPFCGTDLDSSR